MNVGITFSMNLGCENYTNDEQEQEEFLDGLRELSPSELLEMVQNQGNQVNIDFEIY